MPSSLELLTEQICQVVKKISDHQYEQYLTDSFFSGTTFFFQKDNGSFVLIDYLDKKLYIPSSKTEKEPTVINTADASILYDSLCELVYQVARYHHRNRIYDFFAQRFAGQDPTPKPESMAEIYLNCSYKYYKNRLTVFCQIANPVNTNPVHVHTSDDSLISIFYGKHNGVYFWYEIEGYNPVADYTAHRQKCRDALKSAVENWTYLND